MDKEELRAWLRLSMTHGVGNDAARRLLACFGSPQSVFEQPLAALREVVSAEQTNALMNEPIELPVQCVRTQQWLTQSPDQIKVQITRAIWTLGDARYPAELLQLADPPLMLYVQGQTDKQLGNALAIVGSRNPTPQGAQTADQFGEALSQAGLCVVSGLALGVDGAAHQGALRGGSNSNWRTVAVVGTGLDRVYPRQHQTLARDIAEHGILMSEYLLGTPPLPQNFPKRNRLIAALGLGTLVVEAALKSGSLITAKLALELGREVLAIPGSIHATQSHGCHALIRQGAKLVETAQDVLEELQFNVVPPFLVTNDADQVDAFTDTESNPLLGHMGFAPVGLDALQARCDINTAELQVQLMTLELEGYVARLPGGLYQRLGR